MVVLCKNQLFGGRGPFRPESLPTRCGIPRPGGACGRCSECLHRAAAWFDAARGNQSSLTILVPLASKDDEAERAAWSAYWAFALRKGLRRLAAPAHPLGALGAPAGRCSAPARAGRSAEDPAPLRPTASLCDHIWSRGSRGEAASTNSTPRCAHFLSLRFFAPAFFAGDFFVLELDAFWSLAPLLAPAFFPLFVVLAFIAMAVFLMAAAA